MQKEILEANPDATLEVYAVWFNMFPGDHRNKWPEDLLTDPRVTHYWDEGRTVGSLFSEWFTRGPGHVEWDAFFVFGPDAEWGEKGARPLGGWGRTIVGAREQLRAEVKKLIE